MFGEVRGRIAGDRRGSNAGEASVEAEGRFRCFEFDGAIRGVLFEGASLGVDSFSGPSAGELETDDLPVIVDPPMTLAFPFVLKTTLGLERPSREEGFAAPFVWVSELAIFISDAGVAGLVPNTWALLSHLAAEDCLLDFAGGGGGGISESGSGDIESELV